MTKMQNRKKSSYDPKNLQNPIAQRLAEYIDYKQFSIRSFERSINVRQGWLHSMRASIRPEKLMLILEEYPDINVRWLYTGKGDMLENAEQTIVSEDGTRMCVMEVKAWDQVKKLTDSVQNLTQENLILQDTVAKLTESLHSVLMDGQAVPATASKRKK